MTKHPKPRPNAPWAQLTEAGRKSVLAGVHMTEPQRLALIALSYGPVHKEDPGSNAGTFRALKRLGHCEIGEDGFWRMTPNSGYLAIRLGADKGRVL